ncbi:MAG: hypothetical protein K2G69_03825 [Muribaculaceae bacterium]|nr:hypothetical protein [Muribaculaceae bacterium]
MQKDTLNLCLDNLLIGNTLMHKGVVDSAAIHFSRAYNLSAVLPRSYREYAALHKAVLFSETERHDSALFYVRELPHTLWEDVRPWAVISIADIYYKAQHPDSAYKYAALVVNSPDSTYDMYRRRAYSILLSPSLERLVDRDSVYPMTRRWLATIKREFDRRDAGSVARQKSEYNYSLHQRKREEAETRNLQLGNLASILILLMMGGAIAVLVARNNKKKEIIRLLETINMLRGLLSRTSATGMNNSLVNNNEVGVLSHISERTPHLEKECRQLIRELIGGKDKNETEAWAIDTEFYGELRRLIETKVSVPPGSPFWERLECAVRAVSPKFIDRLDYIIPGLTGRELRVCMLIKCKIRPSQIGVMLTLSRQGVNSLRARIRKKMWLADLSPEEMDRLIGLL